MVTGWASKVGWKGKAHYVVDGRKTACADMIGPHGVRMGDLMKCRWRELNPDDHLCGLCARLHPRPCACGVCRVKATHRISEAGEEKR